MNIRMTAEIVPEPGDTFAIKIDIGGVPSQAQASEIGAALDAAIRSYFDGKGARLTRSLGEAPGSSLKGPAIIKPN